MTSSNQNLITSLQEWFYTHLYWKVVTILLFWQCMTMCDFKFNFPTSLFIWCILFETYCLKSHVLCTLHPHKAHSLMINTHNIFHKFWFLQSLIFLWSHTSQLMTKITVLVLITFSVIHLRQKTYTTVWLIIINYR